MSSADSSSIVDLFFGEKKYQCFFGFGGYNQSVALCDSSCTLRTFKYTATEASAGNFL